MLAALSEHGALIPLSVCELLRSIRSAVQKKLPAPVAERAVASLFFLRLVNPALCGSTEEPSLRRSLVLLSKLLQTLANGVTFGEKEGMLVSCNPWLAAARPLLDSFVFDCVFAIRKVRGGGLFLVSFVF